MFSEKPVRILLMSSGEEMIKVWLPVGIGLKLEGTGQFSINLLFQKLRN